MKRIVAVTSGFVLTLMLSAGAFAATKSESKTLNVDKQVQVGNATLQPGQYEVTFEEGVANPQVAFHQGKHQVAVVPAKMKELGTKTEETSLLLNTATKVPVLQEINFSGSNQGLVLAGNAPGMASGK